MTKVHKKHLHRGRLGNPAGILSTLTSNGALQLHANLTGAVAWADMPADDFGPVEPWDAEFFGPEAALEGEEDPLGSVSS